MGSARARHLRWSTRLSNAVLFALGLAVVGVGCEAHRGEGHALGSGSSRERSPGPSPPIVAQRAAPDASLPQGDAGTPRSEIERLLLPIRSYRERVRSAPGTVTMRVECPDRSLTYVGFQHSSDPTCPGFTLLEAEWGEFVRRSRGRHRRVLVEGRVREAAPHRDGAIADRGGEGGLVTFLARRDGVDELVSPEPAPDALVQSLRSRFEPGAICVAYFARAVALWHAQGAPVPLEPFIESLPLPRSSGCGFSLEPMAVLFEQWIGVSLDPNDAELFRWLTDPTHDDTVVARVLRADTEQRDAHVVSAIEQRFSAGEALFAVYGTAHVIMQEPALREILCRRCTPGSCRVEVTRHADGGQLAPDGRLPEPPTAASGTNAAGYSGGSSRSATSSP